MTVGKMMVVSTGNRQSSDMLTCSAHFRFLFYPIRIETSLCHI